MTAITDGICIRATGIAGATLASSDLARARVFYIVRLGFRLLLDDPGAFVFAAGNSAITVQSMSSTPTDETRRAHQGIDGIVLWCTGDEVRRVAEALTAAGIENAGVKTTARLATETVSFDDPDGIGWELRVR